jgi:hypothetical protein
VRGESEKNNKNKNLKEHQQPSISIGGSIRQIKHYENTIKTKQQRNDETFVLSNDFKHRGQILLEKLTLAIENRSKELILTDIHRHTSYRGNHHSIDNPILSQRPSILSDDRYTE